MAPKRPTVDRSLSNDSGISAHNTTQPRKSRTHSTSSNGFDSASLKEYLELDDRPTFVVSLVQGNANLKPIFVNQALQQKPDLRDVVEACLKRWHEHSRYIAWLLQPMAKAANATTQWSGKRWKRVVVGGKWVVAHCCGSAEVSPSDASARKMPATASQSRAGKLAKEGSSAKDPPTTDGTLSPLVDWTHESVESPNQYVQFLRDHDWSSTSLGPMKEWSWHLKSILHTLMADPFPGIVLWGPRQSLIYNQACMQIIGQKHPDALGGEPQYAFDELWPHISKIIAKVRQTGRAAEHHNLCLPLLRQGVVEETFWTFTVLPVIGADGRVIALYDRFLETTRLNITERRQRTLVRLAELGAISNDLKDLWKQLLKALGFNVSTPFAAIYSVSTMEESVEGSASSRSAASQAKACELEGSFGIPQRTSDLPQTLDLQESEHALIPALRQAWKCNEPILLQKDHGTLPSCINIKKPVRGYDEECIAAVVIPIRVALENNLVAFVILGLNPRRLYDDDYGTYVKLLQTRMVELAANIHLPDEERRMQANLREETLRQATLASRLLSRTQEAEQKQQRFMRLAENAPIGMAMYDAESRPIFFNNAYFEMTGQEKATFGPYSWTNAIHDDDKELVQKEWKKLTEDGMPVTIQHRVKQPWKSVNPIDGSEIIGEKWLLSSAFPEITSGEPGTSAHILGWTIDISHQKWAEKLQHQRLEDALENKRQSENFIDMTSHEMRNPLSAILQSIDGINAALSVAIAKAVNLEALKHLHSISENAQNIVLCAQHQKRIVDDILTLSKLDSNLLLITPDRTDPIAILRHVLKMYEAELSSSKIFVELRVDLSYTALDIRFVLLDPSRLLQVLINLLTNAIKFTQLHDKRIITLSVAASRSKPSTGPNGACFVPINSTRAKSNQAKSIHCEEDPVYLTFAVQDSGRGLSDDEKKVLFNRFQQANPRTHVKYGGSGLGLFISRELTELQGGQIGVVSALGEGSTFAFYIRACRVAAPGASEEEPSESASFAAGVNLPFITLPLRPPPTMTPRTVSAPEVPVATALVAKTAKGAAQRSVTGTERSGLRLSSVKEGAGIHVLIVEDNIINQRVMAKQLSSIGCTVHVANHGGEALDFLEGSQLVALDRNDSGCDVSELHASADGRVDGPTAGVQEDGRPALDVVLMDLEMPVMDGLTCVSRIRSMQRQRRILRHVPIICITANAREAQIEQAKNVGCDLVVTKPFRIPELMPQMKKLIADLKGRTGTDG